MRNDVLISLKNVCKRYSPDSPLATNNVSLEIFEGEFVTLLGPSGCGKTTTLRMIAGFEAPTSGEILLAGKNITEIPPYRRPINTVFQRYALFPHLNVFNNIAFGLKLKRFEVPKTDKDGNEIKDKNGNTVYTKIGYAKSVIADKVRAALRMVDLSDYEERDVDSLSGGQQQRVAIARALVNEPKVLLLDEPLGALDLKMRQEMQLELRAMHKRAGITFVYVTHDQEEALTMSDKIVVMKDGIIQQVGTPIEIYNEPANAFVADFIGESNIISGKMPEDKKVIFAEHAFDCVDTGFKKNELVDVVVRPEDIFIMPPDKQGQINGRVVTNIFKGVHYEMGVEAGGIEFLVQDTKYWEVGAEVALYIMPEDIHIMRKERTVNSFTATVTKDYKLRFADTEWECDLLSLFSDLKMNENGTIVDANGDEFDFSDIEVKVEVGLKAVSLTDDIDDGMVGGTIVQQIFKGDHWQVAVRTEDGTDFYVDLIDNYDSKDIVGIRIDPSELVLKEYTKVEEE